MIHKEALVGGIITLRTITLSDCTETYVSWLNDPAVNKYLETRFELQTLQSIRQFVDSIVESDSSYLFAMNTNDGTKKHIGNIKLGPIHPQYSYADISYFIGDRGYWGKGIATEAIKLVAGFAFDQLKLHRVQAGVFEDNIGSIKALEKAGFIIEGKFQKQLRVQTKGSANEDRINTDVKWQDHLYYGMLNKNEE